MFTLDLVKEELEKAKADPVTSRNAQDYAALIIIHDHLCKHEEMHGHKWEKSDEESDEYKLFDNGMPTRGDGREDPGHTQPARSHYEDGQRENGKPLRAGGTFWMEPARESQKAEKLDKQTGEKWLRHMRDDKDEPIKPWSAEELKPLARRYGVEPSGEHFEDFYVTIHMMRSDFGAVAREFDVDTPAFYAALADAWLKDPDAAIQGHDKLEAYYCCIANK